MAAASIEVTVAPESVAGIAALTAIVAIDLAALRWGKATISRFTRHQIHEHPFVAAAVAALLAAHLVVEVDLDPLRRTAGWIAHHIARGDA